MDPAQILAMLQQGAGAVPGVQQPQRGAKMTRVEEPAVPFMPALGGIPQNVMTGVRNTLFGKPQPKPQAGPMQEWTTEQLPDTISSYTMAAPPLMPGPASMDTSAIEAMINTPFQELEAPAPHKTTDLKPYAEARKGMGPKDLRKDAKTRRGEDFRDAFAAAAGAVGGADSLGDVIAAAGAGFGGSMAESRRAREMEDRMFEEATRQFNLEMNALDMELAQNADAIANAQSDRDYQHRVLNQERLLQHKDKITGMAIQLAQIKAEERTAQMQAAAQNNFKIWELGMPQYNEDMSMVSTTEFSPDGKNMTRSVKPVGMAGKMKQLEELGTVAPAAEMLGKEQLGYDKVMQMAPNFGQSTLLSNIMRGPNADKILDPGDVTGWNFLEDPLGIFGYAGDALSESSLEKIQNKVKKSVEAEAKAGLIPPDKIAAVTQTRIAQEILKSPDPELRKRIMQFGTPGDIYGARKTGLAEQRR